MRFVLLRNDPYSMYDTTASGNWYKADEPWGAFLQGDGNPAVTVHPYESDPSSGAPLTGTLALLRGGLLHRLTLHWSIVRFLAAPCQCSLGRVKFVRLCLVRTLPLVACVSDSEDGDCRLFQPAGPHHLGSGRLVFLAELQRARLRRVLSSEVSAVLPRTRRRRVGIAYLGGGAGCVCQMAGAFSMVICQCKE